MNRFFAKAILVLFMAVSFSSPCFAEGQRGMGVAFFVATIFGVTCVAMILAVLLILILKITENRYSKSIIFGVAAALSIISSIFIGLSQNFI
ncbi:hypothetical protein [Mucilaginibacter sp.]|uniref:hypothetical protein n=1 Tax=Mucilaginibacter sp. TaxID=1882438 RepID=UPI003265FD1E